MTFSHLCTQDDVFAPPVKAPRPPDGLAIGLGSGGSASGCRTNPADDRDGARRTAASRDWLGSWAYPARMTANIATTELPSSNSFRPDLNMLSPKVDKDDGKPDKH
jgi:hypothetical protein